MRHTARPQWWKRRNPENAIAIWYSLAAAITWERVKCRDPSEAESYGERTGERTRLGEGGARATAAARGQ